MVNHQSGPGRKRQGRAVKANDAKASAAGNDGKTLSGVVFNIQRYSTEDGPGIRTTVFVKGCPLHCAWCANPESQVHTPQVGHFDTLCTKCSRCVEACLEHAISITDAGPRIDRAVCNDCGECVKVCSERALRLYGSLMTVDEVFSEVQRDHAYYRVSGGGVTVSGGEPLYQADFVAALFRRCKDVGIHTTLDTCGSASLRQLEQVLPLVDLVLFDFKLIAAGPHKQWTGATNASILRNARRVAQSPAAMVVRVPLVPGITDTDENIGAIARVALDLGRRVPVELLPYHRFGTGKYNALDRPYELPSLLPQPDSKLQRVVAVMRSFGIEARIEGRDL